MSTDLLQTPRPLGGFRCILADPPWEFITFDGRSALPQRAEIQHYPTMTKEELWALPVRDMAARDCALIMWVTDSHLDQGLALGARWGFTFKTAPLFIWRKTTLAGDKTRMSMGHWARKEAEICVLFTRGKPRRRPGGGGVRQFIDAPRREHSRKPEEQYERIEKLVYGPRLELFARTAAPGWTAWGNQTDLFDGAACGENESRTAQGS